MNIEFETKLMCELISIMSDGFNRSLDALESTGAISRETLNKHHSGLGSKYYDVVTERLAHCHEFNCEEYGDRWLRTSIRIFANKILQTESHYNASGSGINGTTAKPLAKRKPHPLTL